MRRRNPTPDNGNLTPVLEILLNDSMALASGAKQAHWNVKGPSFQGLHELFDKIHASAVEYADLIGERLAQFGKRTRLRPDSTDLKALRDESASGEDLVTDMAKNLSVFARRLREACALADEKGDAATLDILSEILRGTDKWLWMVESHGAPIGAARFNPRSTHVRWKGRSAGRPLSSFDQRALASGEKVELEHTDRPGLARRIAADHLAEDPRYYEKLASIHDDTSRRIAVNGPKEALRPVMSNGVTPRLKVTIFGGVEDFDMAEADEDQIFRGLVQLGTQMSRSFDLRKAVEVFLRSAKCLGAAPEVNTTDNGLELTYELKIPVGIKHRTLTDITEIAASHLREFFKEEPDVKFEVISGRGRRRNCCRNPNCRRNCCTS